MDPISDLNEDSPRLINHYDNNYESFPQAIGQNSTTKTEDLQYFNTETRERNNDELHLGKTVSIQKTDSTDVAATEKSPEKPHRFRDLLSKRAKSAAPSSGAEGSDHEDGKREKNEKSGKGWGSKNRMGEHSGETSSRARSAFDAVRAVDKMKRKAKRRKDEEEIAAERDNREKYLRNADNLKRAHAVMRETFMDLLSDKLDKDREEIQERSEKWEEKMRLQEIEMQKERRSRVPKKTRVDVSHDKDYLHTVPKSRIYQVLQLREERKKEGKLKYPLDEDKFWEDIRTGNNPVDEEMKQKIQDKKMQQETISKKRQQKHVNSGYERESAASNEDPSTASNIFMRLLDGKSAVQQQQLNEAEQEEISDQLPNLLNMPQFTKRGKSSRRRSVAPHPPPPEPDPILDVFKRPELPKFKSLEIGTDTETVLEKEHQVHLEELEREQRDKDRLRQKKQVQVMYQNAITHMAFTNRLMSRGFHDLALGSTVRDLVEQEKVGSLDIRIPKSPVPRLEHRHPAATFTHSQNKLVPLEARPDAKPYKDKQYDKPSSTQGVDRRRVKKSVKGESGDSGRGSRSRGAKSGDSSRSLEPFRGEKEAAALSLQAIIPTSVVKQPRWHRSMWTNYNNIGVNNPDEQTQKWEQHMSKLGRELADHNSILRPHTTISIGDESLEDPVMKEKQFQTSPAALATGSN
ncbi:uncharacterized protein DDB_G0284459-like isoform X2 [Symsagittifera roscoffensis]|uniref:uncharacterized protein DDB_G0284459-like isoform X2 n=1 Tax=Symsagittifera roscoffensis TaxID=84072 RepID=UPI00307CA804